MDGLPEQAACKNCKYLLRGLSEPRCPECGAPFDPDDARTYWLPGPERRWPWVALGFGLSALHLGVALALFAHVWTAVDLGLTPDDERFTRVLVAAYALFILMQPTTTLSWLVGDYIPGDIWPLLAVGNSGLWGLAGARLIRYLVRRRRRRQREREGSAT